MLVVTGKTRRRITALIPAAAVLFFTILVALPHGWHDHTSVQQCAICHVGHLPVLAAAPVVEFQPLVRLTWPIFAEPIQALPDLRFDAFYNRGPPA